jgi:hypothetical protein
LPWAADGYSPYIEIVVEDAREKAVRSCVDWFFTWNINELLLWQLNGVGALGWRFPIAKVQRSSDLENSKQLTAIRSEIEKFTLLFARILSGERGIDARPPDIYFIHSMESFLERPIALTKLELDDRFQNRHEKTRLETWMRDRQGWPLGGDQDELLLRAAKFTNYTAVNRLIFYEALRKRFTALPELSIGTHIKDAESLFGTIRAFLDEARGVTGDYETVFGVDPSDIGDRIPFYDNSVVDSWRRLCAHVHIFDFTKLEYDVIGQIFETLISPEERHKYGQYYTRRKLSTWSIRFVFGTVIAL